MVEPPVPASPTVRQELARIALERARTLSPFVLFGTIAALLASESSGIPLYLPVLAYNAIAIVTIGLLIAGLWTRRIPEPYAHVALAIVWALPTGGTLMSQYYSGSQLLTMVLIVEIASIAIMLHPGWVAAALVMVDVVYIPLAFTSFGPTAMAYIWPVLLGQLFAVLIHRLMRGSLVRVELHRQAEVTTTGELARQLAELRRSEDERAKLQQQLVHAQRLEATGTLAAGLAHDMNNVLASITTLAELQLDAPAQTTREDLEEILAQAVRGAALTRGLLAFSRRGQYRKQVLRIDELVSEVVPMLARTLPKTVQVVSRLDADACIEGDPAQLVQILVNFGLNASDAMSAKGTLTIETDRVVLDDDAATRLSISAGPFVRLRVTDDGAGMDELTRLRVFEPFFTTKAAGKGTGLGLSIAWGVIHNHGGTVTVDSTPAAGTTFCVYLPVTTARARSPQVTPMRHTTPRPACTVLVIDDEPAVRACTIRLLERQGLRVLAADNGETGLATFIEHAAEIDLVILDMGMPVMNGTECFAEIRKLRDVPILIATGYAVDADAQALVARGASLIEKPYRSRDLIKEVTRLLTHTEEGPYGGEVVKPSSVSWRPFI